MKGRNVRLGEKMLEKLQMIQKQEEERGNTNISFARAGEILAKRIDSAGGLR